MVKNYSSTPPYTAYFFIYPTILSSVPTPVIDNDRSLKLSFFTQFILRPFAVQNACLKAPLLGSVRAVSGTFEVSYINTLLTLTMGHGAIA